MPQTYDGFDLAKGVISVNFLRSDKRGKEVPPINVRYNGSKIRFGWLLDSQATHVAGQIKFEIRAIGVNSNGDAYVWKSKIFDKMNVVRLPEVVKIVELSVTPV